MSQFDPELTIWVSKSVSFIRIFASFLWQPSCSNCWRPLLTWHLHGIGGKGIEVRPLYDYKVGSYCQARYWNHQILWNQAASSCADFADTRIGSENTLNQSIYNILHWVAWTMGQTNRRPRVWCYKYYFFILFVDLGHSKLFIFVIL